MASAIIAYLLGALTTGVAWFVKSFYFPDLLNKRAQEREEKSKLSEDERKFTREDSAIRGRLQAALIAQCRAMQRVFIRGEFPFGQWKELHDELDALVNRDDAARALGEDFVAFKDAVESDRWNMRYVQNLEPGKLHDAFALQAVADVVKRFSVLLGKLGDGQSASRYGDSADKAREQAQFLLTQPPAL